MSLKLIRITCNFVAIKSASLGRNGGLREILKSRIQDRLCGLTSDWVEVLEPDNLGEHFPIHCVKVSTGDNHSQSVVVLVQDKLRVKDSIVKSTPFLLKYHVHVDFSLIVHLRSFIFSVPFQEESNL
jgi:hypothetical protein